MFSSKFLKKAALTVAMTMTVASLAGCGSEPAEDATSDNVDAAAQEIIIGGNFPLTGGVATYGNSVKKGVELAFEEINAAGGVNGAQFKLEIQDNKSESSEAINAATKLITQKKIDALIGPVISSNSIAVSAIAMQNKIPMLTPTGTSEAVTVDESGNVKEYIYRSCFIDPFQGTIGAEFSYNDLSAKKAAVYIDTASDYSKGLAAKFESTFAELGGEIVAKEAYVTKDTDFKATLTKIKGTNPDIIYVPGYYEEVGKIVRQARELGMEQPIIGGDGFDSAKLVEIAGADSLNSVFFTNHYSAESDSQKVQDFIKNYKAKFNEDPDAFAALAYDAVYIMANAFENAGSTDHEAVNAALEATKDFDGVCGKMSYDEKHNPIKSAVIIELVNGEQHYKTTINP